ncbi:hypothetical protein JCM11251_002550 [Rhodosporidiobolus azoricus]
MATYAAPAPTSVNSVSYLDAIKTRRSVYALGKDLPISNDRVVELTNEIFKHIPSSFNSQSSRAVVLFGESHTKLWGFVKTALKAILPAEAYPASEARLNGFEAAAGTVLLFEDVDVVKGLQDAMPTYAEHFPTWSEHTHGGHAIALWTALAAEGVGANLQHYGNLIESDIEKAFSTPANWKIRAQLVFGSPLAPAGEKEFKPLEERVKVFN